MYNFLYKYITPIFGYIMLFFYGIVDGFNGSYGIAIILFTIFARLVTLPTTISQQKSMAKQQRLTPKIRRIQEKYAGNQQKIQLISALVTEPQLLILDEPLSGLDPVNANQFREVIRDEVKKGKYIIMSSHQMSTIEEFCQDIVILNKGKAVLKGNLGEIKKSYGRVNLAVKSDDDISQIARRAGLVLKEKTPEESLFRVSAEEQARAFLADAVSCGASIVKFELTEPSLHEIFVEKVGEQNGL